MPKILQRVGTIKIFNIMKSYKKATLIAKNARSGSYAAGCPTDTTRDRHDEYWAKGETRNYCYACECAY